MQKCTRSFFLSVVSAIIGSLSIGVVNAQAIAPGPCGLSSGSYVVANGDSCAVVLTQSNVDLFDNNILVRLLITNPTSGNTTIQLAPQSAPNGLTLLGFDRFGFKGDGEIIGFPIGWGTCSGQPPFNISAFGTFDVCANEPAGNDSPLTFTPDGDIGSIPANVPQGSHFVTHLRFSSVADPSTFLLFGAGLLAAAAWIKKALRPA